MTTQGRCEQHARQAKRRRDQAYNERRGSSTQQGYGSAHRRLRLLVMHEEPLCRHCLAEGRTTPSVDMDHIVPLSQGGTNDRSNLQMLCRSHHSIKTNREQRERIL